MLHKQTPDTADKQQKCKTQTQDLSHTYIRHTADTHQRHTGHRVFLECSDKVTIKVETDTMKVILYKVSQG